MNQIENKIQQDTAAEIARLEGELDFLRLFQRLLRGDNAPRPKRKYTRRKNASPAKSARKVTLVGGADSPVDGW